jgi:hypothetical protein
MRIISMSFKHSFVTTPDLECVTEPTGRYYIAPDGRRLDSITTVLGRLSKGKKGLVDWRKRLGDKEADGVMRQAATRGTAVHDLLEQYLLNTPDCLKKVPTLTMERFRALKPHLDKNISEIFGLELPLYSYEIMAAGRMDMACIWDGIPSIVDFKTANRLKTLDFIENYFIQAAAYAHMLEALTGLNTLKLVILIMVEHESPQIFIENRSDWEGKMFEIFKRNQLTI